MRLLVYGLQNSGATLFTLFAGQRPGSLVIPDLWTMYCAPRIDGPADACVKATVTTAFPLARHQERFRPDRTILVVRRPEDNYASLRRKRFRHHDGTMEEKFERADALYAEPGPFDAVLRFEDFVADPAAAATMLERLGWSLPEEAARFPRTLHRMEQDLWRAAPALYDAIEWGTGNARVAPLAGLQLTRSENPEARAFASRHAPALAEAYRSDPPAGPAAVETFDATQSEADFFRSEMHAGRLAGLFNDALSDGALDDARILLDDLRALAPDSSVYWTAALRFDEGTSGAGHAARDLGRRLAVSGDPKLQLVLAAHHLRRRELDAARRLVEAALSAEPASLEGRLLAARLDLASGNAIGAEGHARAALAAEPRSIQANLCLADALAKLGRTEEAEETYRFCLALSPDLRPARRGLAALNSGAGKEAAPGPEQKRGRLAPPPDQKG
ncbi:tetratricopeptide repeat protein [Propylenella binzhouense]|uniref:Tetratricopeptide repeat protein n=1 Tax=Propylenella binzhouense TaxID=2555902 RepID=A0A964WUC5_9HYPH|nr:hypothetical protein [Propylenella binzhouense]MYZ48889.1 hypothetical protein [Propylenella binzhouense]